MLNQNNENTLYAGFFLFFAAYIIDCILVGLALLVIKIPYFFISIINPDIFIGKPILFKFSAVDIILYLLSLVYFVLMTYFCGATLGKKALKIKVIKQNREKLSLVDVVYRESIGRYLSGLIIFIGYIMIAVDSKKRGLHDILCDTFVIHNFDNELNINNVCGNLEVQQTEIKPELASEELLNSDNNDELKPSEEKQKENEE